MYLPTMTHTRMHIQYIHVLMSSSGQYKVPQLIITLATAVYYTYVHSYQFTKHIMVIFIPVHSITIPLFHNGAMLICGCKDCMVVMSIYICVIYVIRRYITA